MASSNQFKRTFFTGDTPDDDTIEQYWLDVRQFRRWTADRIHSMMEAAESIDERRRLQQLMKELTGFSVGIQEEFKND